MKLNDLEARFFEQVLNADLGTPVHATVEYEDDTFEVILAPELNEDGQFILKYYNAPRYEPETQFNDAGVGTKSLTNDQAFGRHPSLKQAWLDGDPITVRMRPSQLPFKPELSQKLKATVLYAGLHHRGALALDRNQVTLQEAPLTRAEFSVVELPEFVSPNRRWESVAGIGTPERKALRSLASRLGDDATISIRPSAHHVLLDSGNGWNIKLTRDEQQTRDMISHTGLIEKGDGGEYGTHELGELLEGLKYFFAFTVGIYCFPTVIIGYDSQNRPTWGEIGRFVGTGHRHPNWFNNSSSIRSGVALEALFPIFWSRWGDYKDAMVAMIECYVHSNAMRKAGVLKDAVAKSYAGLEILASLASHKTIYGGSSEEILKVLSDYQIPNLRLDRTKTPAMARLCKNLGESEMRGPCLLGGVRNYVAHPLNRDAPAEVKDKYLKYLDVDPVNCFYLHDLSQFYLEYGFLKFLGFENIDSHRQLLETIQQL